MSRALLEFLHRALWQRLPREKRRKLLLGGSSFLAPRPGSMEHGGPPLIVAGPLSTNSGLGEHSRQCYEAAQRAGIETYGIDLSQTLMQASDNRDFSWRDGRAHRGPGTLLIVANSPILPLAMLDIGRRVTAEKRVVGYWAWELPQVPAEWRRGIPFVHEIWAPSSFTAEAIRPIVGDKPLRTVPIPVANTLPLRSDRPAGDAGFTVLLMLNVASSFERKNPLAAIRAFRAAFGDAADCRLIVKVSNLSSYPPSRPLLAEAIRGARNIEMIDRSVSGEEIEALYARSDTIISLHRSEGFGLVMAEAMIRGLPVVATGWSGNTDFCTPDTSIPIGFDLVPALDPQGTYQHPDLLWADAWVDEASAALVRLRADPALRARLGTNARELASSIWSGAAFAAVLAAADGPH